VRGEVVVVREAQHHVAVEVRVGGLPEPLTAYVDRRTVRALALLPGRRVAAALRDALHVIPE
jgi:hypothetical protein